VPQPLRPPATAPSALRYLELTREPVGVHDFEGRYVYVNDAVAAMAGRSADELLGQHWREVVHPADHEHAAAVFEGVISGKPTGALVVRAGPRQGPWRWFMFTVVVDQDARLVYAVGKDVTDGHEAEERFRAAFENAAIGMAITGLDGCYQRVNDCLCEMLGREADDLIGTAVADITHPDHRDADVAAIRSMREGRTSSYRTRKRYLRPDGEVVWASLNSSVVRDGGEPRYVISQMTDISDRVAAMNALARREAELRVLTENTSDFLSRHSTDRQFRYASPASVKMLGWESGELVGLDPLPNVHREDLDSFQRAFTVAATGGEAVIQYRSRHRDGRFLWLETVFSGVRGDDEVIEVVAVSRDVSDRKRAEVELARQATHDSLTGLPNRALFLDRLRHSLARLPRNPGAVAVLFLDLDRFKLVNDSLGHRAGDRLLIDVADRLAQRLRPSDTVARFGGDEFTVICEDIPHAGRRRRSPPGCSTSSTRPSASRGRRSSWSRASGSASPRTTGSNPRRWWPTRTPRCTAQRSPAGASSCSTKPCAPTRRLVWPPRRHCAGPSSATSCSSATSRSCTWSAELWSPSKLSCAGSTRPVGSCARRSSWRWQRRRG